MVGADRPRVRVEIFSFFAILALEMLLLAPAVAAATTVVVDSAGDGPDQAPGVPCEAASGDCTLRAAVEVANEVAGKDEINFDSSLFDGSLGGTIELQSQLPALTEPVTVRDLCPPNQFHDIPSRPCAGIDANGAASGFRVESDEIAIEGLSVIGAGTGVAVVGSSDEFVARRDWIGADLAEGAGPNSTGILLGPGANDADIGGYLNGSQGANWIANNSDVGLDLEGASRAGIANNTFGLRGEAPDPNGKDIEITDVEVDGSLVKAVENEVGEEIPGFFGPPTPYCDNGCNVISGALETAIDLRGDGGAERPASGPTVIRSNFIGTDWAGETAIPNAGTGILVGGADHVTIGGPREEEGNLIDGGTRGIVAGAGAQDLLIEGNLVGFDSKVRKLDPPALGGIAVDSHAVGGFEGGPGILDNTVTATTGVDIEASGLRATIARNLILGGDIGIRAYEGEFSPGFYIAENEVLKPASNGILLQSPQSSVVGNLVLFAGDAGIKVEAIPDSRVGEDKIGAGWEDGEEDENEIILSGGAAIEVAGEDSSQVFIRQNVGAENSGPFIDLGGDGLGNSPTGPNGGVQAPAIETAGTDAASGSGAQGAAEIYVFAKKGKSIGEIERFLGTGRAKEGGHWYVEYVAPIPVGTQIAVDQVAESGTSELTSAIVKAPAPDGGLQQQQPPAECEAGSADPCQVHNVPRPITRITGGPHKRGRTATFRFASSRPATFQCSLDGAPFKSCGSPKTYKNLKQGKHLFKVRAKGTAGNVGPVAKRKFSILP